ncbi:hypothetical protein OUZ56_020438 [Daphnia magna]|uniref:Uncharacterized protein n=1 Tax=Daphnia magna TaxID=35525 RepID=A0ABQ9ZEG7_9CRUS|nr:hypothetical protein OUZ56_020438 [Daphnia magna]
MFTQIELYNTRRFSVPRHFTQPLFWLCISIVYAALSLVLCDVIAKVKPGVDVFAICNLLFCFIAFLLCVNILNILFVLMGVAPMLCIAPAIGVLNFFVDYIAPLSLYRAMNKGILLKERQRNARDPLFTNVLHLDSAATAVKQNMIAVLEFIWKKDQPGFAQLSV